MSLIFSRLESSSFFNSFSWDPLVLHPWSGPFVPPHLFDPEDAILLPEPSFSLPSYMQPHPSRPN